MHHLKFYAEQLKTVAHIQAFVVNRRPVKLIADRNFSYNELPPTALSKDYRSNNFNLLRFILASLVILSHSSELADGSRRREILTRIFGTISFGELGVYSFFTLSGFLIAQSWCTNPSLAGFLKKRILRIYPAFVICSLLCAFVFGRLGSDSNYFGQLNLFKFLQGVFYLQLPVIPAVFKGTPYAFVNTSMWSISYEFRCYMLLAMFGVLGFLSKKWIWLSFSAAVLAVSLIPGLSNHLVFLNNFQFILGEVEMFIPLLPFFCAGVCYYLLVRQIKFRKHYAIIAIVVCAICLFNRHTANIGLALFGSYFLFYFAFAKLPLLGFFRKIPDVSYGVYLYAAPIQKLILWHMPTMSPWLLFPITLIIASLFGWLSWIAIEKPALKLKSVDMAPLHEYPTICLNLFRKKNSKIA